MAVNKKQSIKPLNTDQIKKIRSQEDNTMKKAIATMGILFTMAATLFTGAAIPVSAHSTEESIQVVSPAEDSLEVAKATDSKVLNDNEIQDWIDDDEDFSTVRGVPGSLDLRSTPSDHDGDVIGQLCNGQEVQMTTRWDGDYVWVYCAELDSYGWVNAMYLG